jgi:hypothetical protein
MHSADHTLRTQPRVRTLKGKKHKEEEEEEERKKKRRRYMRGSGKKFDE